MPLVPAKCTQCGSALTVDSANEAAVCPHCNTPFITEKAINNYNTTNITNIGSLHADVIKLQDEHSLDNRVRSGETFIKLEDYEAAYHIFDSLIKDCPYDCRSWFGMIKVKTRNLQDYEINRDELNVVIDLYNKSQKVLDNVHNMDDTAENCYNYIQRVQCKLDNLANTTLAAVNKAREENASRVGALNSEISELENKRNHVDFLTVPFKVVIWAIVIISAIITYTNDGFGSAIGVAAALGFAGYILCGILNSTWGKYCDKKRYELSQQINYKYDEINVWNSRLNAELAEYNILLEKANGYVPHY